MRGAWSGAGGGSGAKRAESGESGVVGCGCVGGGDTRGSILQGECEVERLVGGEGHGGGVEGGTLGGEGCSSEGSGKRKRERGVERGYGRRPRCPVERTA